MKNMKFKILSPEHSEAVQTELFRLGYRWLGEHISRKTPRYTDKTSLYTNGNVISYGRVIEGFSGHPNKETTLEELKLM